MVPGPGHPGEPKCARPVDATTGDVPNHALSPRFRQLTHSARGRSGAARSAEPQPARSRSDGRRVYDSTQGASRTEVFR